LKDSNEYKTQTVISVRKSSAFQDFCKEEKFDFSAFCVEEGVVDNEEDLTKEMINKKLEDYAKSFVENDFVWE
jgi:hypothetical protein